MQPQHLELDRAPHRSPARERAPSSLLARTRTAVRERFRGSADPDAVRLREEGAGVTVRAFLEGWLTEVARVTVRPRTYTSYRYVVRVHLAPGLGNLPLAFLSPADVQGFLNAKSTSGLSPRTVGYLRGVLRGALGHAERTDLVTRNVARLARPPRIPRRRVSPLSVEQVRTFVAAIAGDRLEALYLVALGVGRAMAPRKVSGRPDRRRNSSNGSSGRRTRRPDGAADDYSPR
jgi:integrase